MMYFQNLEVCLKRRFNAKFYNYINNLEGAELSGSDTDTDE